MWVSSFCSLLKKGRHKKAVNPSKIHLKRQQNKIMAVKMPICCPAQWMSLRLTIRMVINEKLVRVALNVQPQWQWRRFNRHRSVKGADRLCSNYTGHKGALVSRRHFILVHILTPQGQHGYGSLGTTARLLWSLSHTASTFWNHHIEFNMYYITHTHRYIPLRSTTVNGRLSSVRKTSK